MNENLTRGRGFKHDSAITLPKHGPSTQRALIRTRRGEIDYGEHDKHAFASQVMISKLRSRETMPIAFSIVDFPPSGSYQSPFGRWIWFWESDGGFESKFIYSKHRFRETMPIVFSILDFPPSGSYQSPFAQTTMFQKSYGGEWLSESF